jgi:tetratricopeptide (TPR) repeat protein
LSSGTRPEAQSLVELQEEYAGNRDDADVAARLAMAHLKRKAHAEARRYALQALKSRPHHQLAAYVLARLYLSIGEARRAEAILTTCLDEENRGREPPQPNALALLAGLRLKAEDYAGAARWYCLGRQHYPHDVKWLKALAGVYLKSNDRDRLAEALAELAELDADDLTIRKKLVQLALERRDFTAAVTWANRAIHVDVMDAYLHAWLAEACVGGGQRDRAVAEYEVAIELAPGNLAWRLALADTLVQAKQPDRARTVLEELLKINPEYPGADVLLESLQP